ncbi:hypothetical protein BLNAU_17988 [Blattamonas nauphoetae]|uniref:Right handed beta helix domain-containing protein n=1 Tax=Blattamonas nauphoetae TaxID=2049346 RepID=A0ABQ9XA31_9EUKA|nr:hypothetical protein BLNAU_17988 [Blattamonas nauphoetae]
MDGKRDPKKGVQFSECEALDLPGAGLFIQNCDPQLDDVNFTSCLGKKDTSYSYGSGIYSTGNSNPVIANSHFVSCKSENQGAGGYLGGPSARIENCTFKLCQSAGFGAAMRIASTSCEIKGCLIDQCQSTTIDTPLIFYDIPLGTLTITNTSITKSVGTGTQGGALRVNSKSFRMTNVQIVDITLNRPTIHYNAQGAAGYIKTVSSDFTDCRFEKCTSAQRAGALSYTNSAGILTQCTFDTCIAEAGNGGAVEIDGTSSVAFVSCIFTACSSGNGDGGAVWANVIANAISFKEGSVRTCSATGSGGGLFVSLVSRTTGTVKLENVEFGKESADLNLCSGSGTDIYVHTTTVPSILNPGTHRRLLHHSKEYRNQHFRRK